MLLWGRDEDVARTDMSHSHRSKIKVDRFSNPRYSVVVIAAPMVCGYFGLVLGYSGFVLWRFPIVHSSTETFFVVVGLLSAASL
jgi:hypothetical protein